MAERLGASLEDQRAMDSFGAGCGGRAGLGGAALGLSRCAGDFGQRCLAPEFGRIQRLGANRFGGREFQAAAASGAAAGGDFAFGAVGGAAFCRRGDCRSGRSAPACRARFTRRLDGCAARSAGAAQPRGAGAGAARGLAAGDAAAAGGRVVAQGGGRSAFAAQPFAASLVA